MSRAVHIIGSGLATAHRYLIRIEKTVLCLLLFSMILLSFSQVILRNFFSFGFIWANEALRTEVIWIAFIGAALATEYNRHIRIDIVSRLIRRDTTQKMIDTLNGLFTAVVSALLFVAAVKYVALMQPYHTEAFCCGIPEWTLRLVIPYAFAAMAIRCGRVVYKNFFSLINPSPPP